MNNEALWEGELPKMTFKMKRGWGYRNEMILLGLGREDQKKKKKISFFKKKKKNFSFRTLFYIQQVNI